MTKLFRCRYPAGRSGIVQDFFEALLAATPSAAERARGVLVRAPGRGTLVRNLYAEMTDNERRIASRALRCYRTGGMVLWDRR